MVRSDAELLDAWRSGDEPAGQALVERHLSAVRRFMRSMAPNDAEDLTQRTFTACIAAREKIGHTGTFRGYLFAIARNELYGHYRSLHRRHGPIGSATLYDLSPNPSELLARSEQEHRLLAALRQLPLDLQVTIELSYWAGLKTRELAQVLGVPEGTVGSRLNRARERLRELLVDTPDSGDPSTISDDDLERWARSVRAKSPLGGEPSGPG